MDDSLTQLMLDGADQTLSILGDRSPADSWSDLRVQFTTPTLLLHVPPSLRTFQLQLSNLEDISLKLKLPRDMSDTSIKTLTPRPTSFIVRLSAVEYANARFNLRDSLDNKTNIANLFESQDKGFTDIAFRGDCGDLPRQHGQVNDTVSSESPAATAAAAPPAVTRKQGSNNVFVIISSIVACIVVLTVLLAIVLWRRRRRQAKAHSPVFHELASSASSSKRQPVIRAPKPLDLSSYDPLELKSSTAAFRAPPDRSLTSLTTPSLPYRSDARAHRIATAQSRDVWRSLSRPLFTATALPSSAWHRSDAKTTRAHHPVRRRRVGRSSRRARRDRVMDGGDLRTLLQTFDSQGRPVGFDACKLQIARHVIEGTRVPSTRYSLRCCIATPQVTATCCCRRTPTRQAHRLWCLAATRRSEQQHDDHLCRDAAVDGTRGHWSGGRYGESADVFSFGVVLSELDTHEIPYNVGGEVRFHRQSDAEVRAAREGLHGRMSRSSVRRLPTSRAALRGIAQRYSPTTAIERESESVGQWCYPSTDAFRYLTRKHSSDSSVLFLFLVFFFSRFFFTMGSEVYNVLGLLGSSVIAAVARAQIYKIWRTKSAKDISYGYSCLFITGSVLIVTYGLGEGSAAAVTTLTLKWLYSRNEEQIVDNNGAAHDIESDSVAYAGSLTPR
ncbi:hypothetical protein PINS_up006981 [Pythium insidiosum]|nr:hypothetical protein PINS_up006981 [Pythium insidiosum]